MDAPGNPPASGAAEDPPQEPFDAFAGLTPIDVIDGELVPRSVEPR